MLAILRLRLVSVSDMLELLSDLLVPDVLVPDLLVPDVLVPDLLVPDVLVPDLLVPDLLVPDVLVPDLPVLLSSSSSSLTKSSIHSGGSEAVCRCECMTI